MDLIYSLIKSDSWKATSLIQSKQSGIPCETTMFKPDTFKRKINFSSHIPFMQNRELLRGEKLCIHGKVVNAPADVNSTVNTYQDQPMNHKLSLLNLNES